MGRGLRRGFCQITWVALATLYNCFEGKCAICFSISGSKIFFHLNVDPDISATTSSGAYYQINMSIVQVSGSLEVQPLSG